MIRRVTLSNWRAYDRLHLDFDEGVTFLVAENGIGKTSIVMAVAWGLLGEASKVDARASIRGDAQSASVEVQVALADGRTLQIARTVTNKGKTKTSSTLDGVLIANELELLQEVCGVDPVVLARLAFMSDGGHIASESEFDLKDHLYRVFGVAALREAEDEAKRLVKAAEDARAGIRRAERQHDANRGQLEQALREIEEQLGDLEEAGLELNQELDLANQARNAAQQWAAYQEGVQQREAKFRDLLEQAGDLIDAKDPEGAQLQLAELEDQLDRQLNKLREEIAGHDARWSLARKAIERLHGAETVCPTCLRPINREEASSAIHEHETDASAMEQALAELNAGLTELTERMSTIHDVRRQLQRMPGSPISPMVDSIDIELANRSYSKVMAQLDAHKEKVSEIKVRRHEVLRQLRGQEEAEAAQAAERLAFRREAVALATARALNQTAERITRERIDPLTQDVATRWKRLFGTGDLILNPNGTIRRKMGSRVLKLNELSGGERIWAQLVTRLLVLAASTQASFVWLDEPLEHLDPKLRRIVAGTLVRAADRDGFRQIVVTTYEESVARQLAEDHEKARLIFIRPGEEV